MQIRGTVHRLVMADGVSFWAIGSDGRDAVRFGAVPRRGSVDVSATPDGSKIGAIVSSVADEVLGLYDSAGREVRSITVSKEKSPSPSPTPAPAMSVRGRLAWNMAGDQLLFAKGGGGIDSVGVAGDPKTMVSPKQAPLPGNVAWSPAGDAIAFASRTARDAGDGLYVGSTTSLPVDAAGLVGPQPQASSIPEIAWLPDGARILFTQRSQNVNEALSGDLFQVLASGGAPKLFISAGLAGPVAAIGLFEASPGGEAIAFTIWAPNGPAIVFQSLWIKPLEEGAAIRIDVSPGSAVNGLWWTDSGLIWREQLKTLDPSRIDGPFTLQRLTLDGKGATVFSSESLGSASPVASPAASPPVASAVASPNPG